MGMFSYLQNKTLRISYQSIIKFRWELYLNFTAFIVLKIAMSSIMSGRLPTWGATSRLKYFYFLLFLPTTS